MHKSLNKLKIETTKHSCKSYGYFAFGYLEYNGFLFLPIHLV